MKTSKLTTRFAIALLAGTIVLALAATAIFNTAGAATGPAFAAPRSAPPPATSNSHQAPAPTAPTLAPPTTAALPPPNLAAEIKSDEIAWKAVERIDAKLANTVVFLTVFVAFIALVLGLYEFFKLNELEKLRTESEAKLQILFDRQFETANKEYEKRLSEKLLNHIHHQTHRLADDQIKLSTVAHRIMLCFVQNDLEADINAPMRIAHMHACMDLQRSLGQLRASNDESNLTGLSHLATLSGRISAMTAGQILNYLLLVRRAKILCSWTNQGLCADIVGRLEQVTGLSADDPAFL